MKKGESMLVDYSQIEPAERYKLMAQTVVPRPIAWIVSEDERGVVNIAPFSYFTPLGSKPPVLVVSIGHRPDGREKDTLRNIRKSRRCTICMASPAQVDSLHLSSAPLPENESEAERFDIELIELREGFPPRIAGAPVAFFATLHSEIELEGSKTVPLILEIESQYIDEECIVDEHRLHLDCDLPARVGPGYRRLGEEIEAPELPKE
jgi:flavin reductase (DIM6/NTAB) family NADH-FMN oxidoreductase RutF